jgi:peptidoglycan LD-endopeptidase CwlK
MSKALDDLDPKFKLTVFQLLARWTEAGIPVLIVETLRTQAQHELNLSAGRSWTKHSKHLDGFAIDVVPYALYTLAPGGDKLEWNSDAPVWQVLGKIGEGLGLRWGGRWTQRDMGHFEAVEGTL